MQWREENGHGNERFVTTMKLRREEGVGMKKRVIDYVFCGKNTLKVVGALDVPREKNMLQDIGNPCFDHPSDHYALAYKF